MGTSGYCRHSLDRRGQALPVQGANRHCHAHLRRTRPPARLLAPLLLLAACLGVHAETNARGWSSYFGDHKVTSRWGVHFDGQFRRDFSEDWNQLLLRPGVNYYLRPNLFFTQGYAWIRTSSNGATTPEHRSWQQLQFMPRALNVVMSHRFRLEQRWIGVSNGHRYQNRFRYFYRTEVPAKGPYFVGLQNEIFLGFGPNHGASTYDQNRAYLSVGKRFGPIGRIEVGYMYQNQLLRDGIRREHNHIAVISFLSGKSRVP